MIKSQLPIHYIPTDNSLLGFASQISSSNSLYHDSFFLLNLSDVLNKIKIWQELLPFLNLCHDISKYDDENFIQFLISLNVGMQCSTKNDLIMAAKTTINGNSHINTLFNGQCKLPAQLKLAFTNDINLVTFSSIQELERIMKVHPNPRLVMKVDFFDFEDYDAIIQNLLKLFVEASKYKENVIGLCFSVPEDGKTTHQIDWENTNIFNLWFNFICELLKMADKLGFNITQMYLDMPNFGVYKNCHDFEEFANNINGLLQNMMNTFPFIKNVSAIATSYLLSSTNASALCTPIISVIKPEDDLQKKQLLFVNNGIYDAFLYQSLLPQSDLVGNVNPQRSMRVRKLSQSTDYMETDCEAGQNKDGREMTVSDICGSTGAEEDKIGVNYHLPSTLRAGDWLIFYFTDEQSTKFKYDSSIKTIFLASEDMKHMLEKHIGIGPVTETLTSCYEMEFLVEDNSEELEVYLKYLFNLNASPYEELADLPKSDKFFISNEF